MTTSLPQFDTTLALDLLKFFDNRADVTDGDYGMPAPDRNMSMAEQLRGALNLHEFAGREHFPPLARAIEDALDHLAEMEHDKGAKAMLARVAEVAK